MTEREALRAACEAALKYDAALAERARTGAFLPLDVMPGARTDGPDLDALYDDWITKARAALAWRNE